MKFQIGTSSLHHSSNVQSQIGTCLNKKMDDIAIIENKIYEIRGQKVMLDFDLAEMYGVETKRLKEQVRRNIERFPAEFMFELTKEEVAISRSQIATLKTGQGYNIKYLPFAFTEYGIVMLSSVLKSKTAVEVNINIIRAFVRMRQYLLSNIPKKELEELKQRIEYLEEDITSDRESYEKQFDAGRTDSGRRELPLCRKPVRAAMVGRRMYQARSRYPLFNSTQNRERNNGYHSRANQQSA